MKTLNEILSLIFNKIKSEKEIDIGILYDFFKNEDLIHPAFDKLVNEYKLLTDTSGTISLSEKGEKFKTFEKYLKSLKRKPLDWYKIIGLSFTFVFGVSTIFFGVRNSFLKTDYHSLKLKFDSLKYQSNFRKDSIVELKKQIELYRLKTLNDTSQTKSLNDLKTD